MDKPSLAADFGYGFKNGYEPNIYVLRGNWFLGVNLEVPIFNGFLTKNKIAEADANISVLDRRVEQVKESISTELYQSLSDYNSNLKKINSTNTQIEFANKYLERANLQYARGAGTNLEVLDAQTALTQARLLNVQAIYKSIVSYYSVKKAAGDIIYDK
jgi:outer membrane protein TolC